MPEIRIDREAKKDLKRIGPGPQRDRIVAGLRRLAEDAPNLDIGSDGQLNDVSLSLASHRQNRCRRAVMISRR